ncbi:hypothetical protein MTR67_041565 [Solanum verrucosum]|uniref:Uncharacterized protein n=1 Tax=Solanum verrucosum TaxID=315347 RepID=A0AAF0ULU1_SOLVR|nr:hypothetical protein MTR67_041565 [Solanum verrucosum]
MIWGTIFLRWEMISDGDFAGCLRLYIFVTFGGAKKIEYSMYLMI